MIGIGFNSFNNKHGGYDKIQDEKRVTSSLFIFHSPQVFM
jgi:hypothetical protein